MNIEELLKDLDKDLIVTETKKKKKQFILQVKYSRMKVSVHSVIIHLMLFIVNIYAL